MYLGEIGWRGMDWIGLAQDRDKWRANTCEPYGICVLIIVKHLNVKPKINTKNLKWKEILRLVTIV
jgi:hypothetical protein